MFPQLEYRESQLTIFCHPVSSLKRVKLSRFAEMDEGLSYSLGKGENIFIERLEAASTRNRRTGPSPDVPYRAISNSNLICIARANHQVVFSQP